MSTNPIRLQQLFDKYINDACTPGELEEFWLLIDELSDNDPVTDDIKNLWRTRKSIWHKADDVDWHKAYNQMLARARNTELDYNTLGRKKNSYRGLLVAASSVILLGAFVAIYILFSDQTTQTLTDTSKTEQRTNDVAAPSGNRAMLTLSDGQKIFLDSVGNGMLAMQGKIKVNRTDAGEIVYDLGKNMMKNEASGEVQYNILHNPRGSKVATLVLADGSKVWLNSESSVTYFTSVGKEERKVEITGEAYFEVAKDKTRPFKVVKKDAWEIQVLGTHFNVKAYEDELQAEITLLEGSIDVVKNHMHAKIKPGQQARIDQSIQIESDVDMEAIMAWKNGQFVFNGADLKTLMQQVARWYDIDVVFKGTPVKKEFGGYLNKDISLKGLMQALQENQVVCELQGRKLIIGE